MKRGMPEKKARNRAIYDQWLRENDFKSQEAIGKEWGLSRQRIVQIVAREQERAKAQEPVMVG